MDRFVKILVRLAAIAAAVAAAAAILYKIKEKMDQRRQMMDAYLMGEDEGATEVYTTGEIDSHLIHDMDSFGELKEGETLEISFHVPEESGKYFQEKLAEMGFSSSMDSANEVADVIAKGPMTKEQVAEMAAALEDLAHTASAVYEGFTFE